PPRPGSPPRATRTVPPPPEARGLLQDREQTRARAMLRITVHDRPRALTFQLEGRLAGPWLRELEECWQSTLAHQGKPILCVDLTGVTFIDAAARDSLAAMHRQGAEFLATDCLTKAIVDEITQGALPDCGRPIAKGERRPKRNRGAT